MRLCARAKHVYDLFTNVIYPIWQFGDVRGMSHSIKKSVRKKCLELRKELNARTVIIIIERLYGRKTHAVYSVSLSLLSRQSHLYSIVLYYSRCFFYKLYTIHWHAFNHLYMGICILSEYRKLNIFTIEIALIITFGIQQNLN